MKNRSVKWEVAYAGDEYEVNLDNPIEEAFCTAVNRADSLRRTLIARLDTIGGVLEDTQRALKEGKNPSMLNSLGVFQDSTVHADTLAARLVCEQEHAESLLKLSGLKPKGDQA